MIVSYEMEGSAEGVEDRNVSVVDATLPCFDAEFFFCGGSHPVEFLPPHPVEDSTGAKSSAWVYRKRRKLGIVWGFCVRVLKRNF